MDEYMKIAIKEAIKAKKKGDVPVGAIIVMENKVISKSYNKKEHNKNAIKHAEILAISKACKKIHSWHLDNCTLYTTIEPCMMCTGAIIQSRIGRVVYGAGNDSFGYLSKINNNKIVVSDGILKDECLILLSNFFKDKRRN